MERRKAKERGSEHEQEELIGLDGMFRKTFFGAHGVLRYLDTTLTIFGDRPALESENVDRKVGQF